jgi:23S rRNA pseudouridine2605 synthase
LSHPRYGVEKTYQVEVAGSIEREELQRLRKGAHLAEGFARVVSAKVKHSYKQSTVLEIVLSEGRNREIRRILARAGHKVLRLKRVALGPLRLAELPPGAVRPLAREEVRELQAAAGQIAHRAKRRPQKTKTNTKTPRKVATHARTVIGGSPAPRKSSGTGKAKKKLARGRRQSPGATQRS